MYSQTAEPKEAQTLFKHEMPKLKKKKMIPSGLASSPRIAAACVSRF